MSLPPHREPFLLNKFLDAEFSDSYELRRPCLGSTNFCDSAYFERMDPTNPFCDSRFPRYKHRDFLYKLPKEAVTSADVDRSDLSPRHEKSKWGMTISNKHSKWRTSFPDRFPRLEGNEDMKVSGPPVYKPALESMPRGKVDLSYRRLRWMENTNGGKVFETRARDERWNRYREGAGPITRATTEVPKGLEGGAVSPAWGHSRIPGQKKPDAPQIKFWSDSEKFSSVGKNSRAGSKTPGSTHGSVATPSASGRIEAMMQQKC